MNCMLTMLREFCGRRSSYFAIGILLVAVAVGSPAHAQTVTATVNVDLEPIGIVVNPVTNKIYVDNQSGPIPAFTVTQVNGTVTAIDGITNATATVQGGYIPQSIALNSVTNKIYLANGGDGTVTVIDGANNTAVSVNVGKLPSQIAVNSVKNKIYVLNVGDATVSVIDGSSNATTTVPVAATPSNVPGPNYNTIAANSVTNKIYVSDYFGSGNVTVIDGVTNATASVAVGASPGAIAVNAVTNKIYVITGNGDVTVIDGVTNATVTLPVGAYLRGIAVNSVTNKIYADGPNGLTVIDGATNASTTVPAGMGGGGLALNSVTNTIYVANTDSTVTAIDGATYTTATIPVGNLPFSIAVNSVTNTIYVANFADGTVTVIRGAAGGIPSPTPTPTPTPISSGGGSGGGGGGSSGSARLINISTRAHVGTGGSILIPGFVIGGSGTETLLIRGDGPSLTGFGVGGALAAPSLSVFDNTGRVVATNTGWETNTNPAQIVSTAASVGAFAFTSGSADCALIASLPAGAYTVQISGVNNTTGVALAEVYEVAASGTRLINISTRAQVGTGANIIIPGFVVSGTGQEELLVRADGPALTPFGVGGVLAQPSLSVFNNSGVSIASNTGWTTTSDPALITSTAAAVGAFAFPTGSKDSAQIINLTAGAYTMQISGVSNSTGVALAEVYEVPVVQVDSVANPAPRQLSR
jgi:YVTN family beta-propeller protein